MSGTNIDYNTVKELRKTKTWDEVSEELNVSTSALTRFSKKNGLKLKQPYQKGKRLCDRCRKFYGKKEIMSCRYGRLCKECSKKEGYKWKYHYQSYL